MSEKHLKARDDLIEAYRVYVSALEERLAALEDIAQTHSKVLVQLQTPPKVALEAQAAPEYAPGYEYQGHNAPYLCGVVRNQSHRIAEFSVSNKGKTADLWLPTELAGFSFNIDELREFIGAAMAVLKRMEVE